MRIKDKPDFLTKPKPITFSPEDSVRSALDVMCEKNIGSIVVIDQDRKVVGIVTERDMMRRVLGKDRNPSNTKLSEIMTTDIKSAHESDHLVDWMHAMSDERFRHLPIVDDDERLVTMMSQGDFVAHTFPDLYEAIRQDIKGRLGRVFQAVLIVFAVLTLGFVAFSL